MFGVSSLGFLILEVLILGIFEVWRWTLNSIYQKIVLNGVALFTHIVTDI